jgi:hydroxypyruvate isomerase
MLRFDANLRWLFTEVPMLERYAAAAQAGFKGVEVAFPYEHPAAEIAARLEGNGLQMVQVLAPFDWDSGERGIASLPGRGEAFKASIRTAVDYAVQIGKPMIHVMPGNLAIDHVRLESMDRFMVNIAWAADYARPAGITLILEPCCRARCPDFLYHRIGDGVKMVKALGRQNVRLCFDTFHIQTEEGAITDHLRATWPHIGHIQVGNVPDRHEPGAGEIHFPYLFDVIEELGWQGWIGCQYTPSRTTLDSLGWAAPYGVRDPRPSARRAD